MNPQCAPKFPEYGEDWLRNFRSRDAGNGIFYHGGALRFREQSLIASKHGSINRSTTETRRRTEVRGVAEHPEWMFRGTDQIPHRRTKDWETVSGIGGRCRDVNAR